MPIDWFNFVLDLIAIKQENDRKEKENEDEQ